MAPDNNAANVNCSLLQDGGAPRGGGYRFEWTGKVNKVNNARDMLARSAQYPAEGGSEAASQLRHADFCINKKKDRIT